MAIETELKLRMTPEHLARLRRHALFKAHQHTPPVTHRLYNIYFDTPGLELHQMRMAVRLRRVAGRWLQTLKGGGSVKAGLHQRLEWEVPVRSAALDFTDLAAWDDYLPPPLREKLQPVFVTDFYRTSRELDWQGAIIEVCMDRGTVKTGQHSTNICEVELELKSGEPQQLFELAQTILGIVPFELEGVSKAEQGFRLLSGYIAKPVRTVMPKLAATDRLADGLQALIWNCLLQFQANLSGAIEGGEAEYLHQMRVALRRLRVALKMAESIQADAELSELRDSFAELTAMLGTIREWDVFIAQLIEPACLRLAPSAAPLLRVCGQQRAERYAVLRSRARALQGLLLRFSIWMNGPYWQQTGGIASQLFAGQQLHRLAKRYARVKPDLRDLQQLHALRICAKKLRYSAEFFASLYDAPTAKSYLSALNEVQEVLGEVNDIAVAHRLLDELLPGHPEYHAVIALIKSELDDNLHIKIKLLKSNINLFNKKLPFWKTA